MRPKKLKTKPSIAEIVLKYHKTHSAPQMVEQFGSHRASYYYQAKILGLTLPNGRLQQVTPVAKEPVIRGSKPAKRNRKPSNKESTFNVKVKDFSSMTLVPLGINKEYVHVPVEATAEEIQRIKEHKIQQIRLRPQCSY